MLHFAERSTSRRAQVPDGERAGEGLPGQRQATVLLSAMVPVSIMNIQIS
jgi:hypothetical protein